jgi:uncharacterized protein YjbI with pentapeptide repeats
MADEKHLLILKSGVDKWNEWQKAHPEVSPDLSGIDLGQANLSGADLGSTDLNRASLCEADLTMANLREADLTGADLGGVFFASANLAGADLTKAILEAANLPAATLRWANLQEADLRGANLSGANLSGADLTGANLEGAILDETVFVLTDLSTTEGLDSCHHIGPCGIDFHTIERSWPLPEEFLRGLGLPEAYIARLPELIEAV